MVKDKSDFYHKLWRDYYDLHGDDKENSFIYSYFKNKKNIRAEVIGRSKDAVINYSQQKKHDKYTLLKSAYLAVTRYKVMDVQEYTDILKSIMGAKLPAKYKTINGQEELDKAEQMFERRFLMGCVGDFFYNLGYRTNKNAGHGQSIRQPSKKLKEDGYNDEFEMLYEFRQYGGDADQFSLPVATASIDDGYIEKCIELYDIMVKEGRTNAFVPLYVDSDTSAGVYIVGVDRFGKGTFGSVDKKQTDVCFVCIIYFYEVEAISRLGNLPEDDISISMWVKERHRSVKKAFASFEKMVTEQDFYENYPFENDDILPDGIDDCFNLYFITKQQNEEYIRKKMTAMIVDAVLAEEAKTMRSIEEKENHTKRIKNRTE